MKNDTKTALIILSDPNAGSDDANGKLFNALAAAYDFKQANQEVTILFQGAGTRWPALLEDTQNPFYALFDAVKDKVQGVSCGCADAFGADASGYDLITTNAVPGTSGLPSFLKLQQDGYQIITF
ncbi:DsrE/DsrF-like family protein [Dyadobacter soli]|uniref:DsrE/DsrF-like family protein n=1 Tax=Dyadobacter soli TaxID=659014 RepID=A0A1G7VNM0_9BACT|nr:DsrE family protein [Dyadobacter soli]SDG61181.1 DsrE/DsrF-like family protein [Dyadobacter soli]